MFDWVTNQWITDLVEGTFLAQFELQLGPAAEAAGDDEVVIPVVGEGEGVYEGAVEVVFGVVDGG